MDNRIRRNEICIIGLPRCDFVFSSTRTCFIAYGFEESSLEMGLLRKLLDEKGIQTEEAGGTLAPAQNAFCAKICSKIITSQFCAILLNDKEEDGVNISNPNVYMEYGLMLGFSKYIIPFQRESQDLAFNIAALDTVKYNNRDFEDKARKAIDLAIKATQQDGTLGIIPDDQVVQTFLIAKKALYTPLDTEGEKNLFNFGVSLGFNLLNDFAGLNYLFFGNFTSLRPEIVIWRLQMLCEIIDGRIKSIDKKIEYGLGTEKESKVIHEILNNLNILLLVTTEDDVSAIQSAITDLSIEYKVEVFSLKDVSKELDKLSRT